jgi:hypothetical protein
MLAHFSRSGAHARLHRLAAVLTTLTCALLASAAAVPAAFATPTPQPLPGGQFGPAAASPVPATVHVVTVGGMAGWQIALIAVGAALVAAAAAVLLDRARHARRVSALPA